MPVPTHFKFTVRGSFKGTPETWSTGFHMSRDVDGNADANLSDIDEGAVTDAMVAFFATSLFSSSMSVDDWRAYDIGTNGKMQSNAPLLHEFAANELNGTGGAQPQNPPQVAVVITTVADNRGPAQFGRMYLPSPNFAVQSDWRLSAGDAATLLGSTVQWLKSVSDAIDLPLTISSSGLNISKGPIGSPTGTKQIITHARCGRVYDTIRNRRKSLVEDYQVSGAIDW